jgi:hypothetical protein
MSDSRPNASGTIYILGVAGGVDNELEAVWTWFQNAGDLEAIFGSAVRTALDEIIDTPRTRRWSLEQCGDQEKAYMGVKLEHVIRGVFNFENGPNRMDYSVQGIDVDCKWSKNFGAWQIPREAVGHLCLLVWGRDETQELAVGLVRIHKDILVGGNQDLKKTIQSPGGMAQVRWLVPRGPHLPANFLLKLPPADRHAILSASGGDARARELFRRCEGIILKRHTIESIGQQVDEGRRFRGETRQRLREEGFEVLNGHWKAQRARAHELGGPVPSGSSEWVCLRSDGSTPARLVEKLAQTRTTLF